MLTTGAKGISSGSWTQILVESGSRVGLRLGTLGMGRNLIKILISREGIRIMAHKVLD